MIPALLRSPVFWMRVVSLVVVISLGLALARLTWRLVGWDDGREAVWTPAALAPVGGSDGADLATILAWAPFGRSATGDGLPASNLGLILKGLIYAPAGGSAALIANGAGPVQTFVEGQTPVGNAVIEVIEIDRVILNVGGRREALALERPAGPAGLLATPSPSPVASSLPSPAPTAAPAGLSADAQAALASASPIASSLAAQSRPTAPRQASPAPTPTSLGVTSSSGGYVIGADSAPELLRAGLRAGDVVRSLNGRALGNPETDRQAFEAAASGGRARVEVVRDGRTLTLTVPLR